MSEFRKFDSGLYASFRGEEVLLLNPLGFRWAVVPGRKVDVSKEDVSGEPEILNLLKADGVVGSDFSREELIGCNRDKGLSIVVLHTTNRCNLSCGYCYSDANSSQDEMSFETARRVIDRVVESEPGGPVKLEFHGGEPTLRPDFIGDVVAYANRFRKGDLPLFRFSIQTNGVSISPSLADLFRENKFSIGVSLDGPKEFHDKKRVHSSGEGSFDEVMKTLDRFGDYGLRCGTICVVRNPSVLDCYPDFLIDKGVRSVKFNPYFEGQGRASDPEMSAKLQREYSDKMLSLADRIYAFNSSDKKFSVGNLSLLVKNLISPNRDYMCLRFPCGAGISMLGVGVRGEVYPCEEMNGNPDLVIGNVHEDSLSDMFSNDGNLRVKNRSLEEIADCPDCFAVDVCTVSCANRSYVKSKGFNVKSSLCEYYKHVIPGLMWKIYDNPGLVKCLL